MLTPDDILNADDLPAQTVPVPEWGGDVRVRGLTGTERDRYDFALAQARSDPASARVRAEIVGRCLVDDDGQRMFSDADIERLGQKSGKVLDRLFDIVRDLSGMTIRRKQEAVEDFDDDPSDGSRSA